MHLSTPSLPILCAAPAAIVMAILSAFAPPARAPGRSEHVDREARWHRIEWRDSVAVGQPEAGSLVRGVRLPATGRSFFTWDPVQKERPTREWRRWGTDELIRTVLDVVRDFHRDHPAIRVGVGDLSRPHGGDFGPQYGFIGHATHQNGLDVDVYYPRVDRLERPPRRIEQVDLALSQELVDRFVTAGAEVIYVGLNTPLRGRRGSSSRSRTTTTCTCGSPPPASGPCEGFARRP